MVGYEEDLAFIHDSRFGDFILEAAPALLRALKKHAIRTGLVVDLGCGTGLWARELIATGYSVVGVDISPAMIERARQNAPGVRFLTASLLDVSFPQADAITAISEAVNYTFDPRNSLRLFLQLCRRVWNALRPGGIFVFDFAEPGQFPDAGPHQSYWEAEDWAVLLEARENHRRRLLTREITTFRRVGKLFRRHDETHHLRLYDAPSLAAELTKIGFTVKVQNAYGTLRLPPAHAAIIAVKPAA